MAITSKPNSSRSNAKGRFDYKIRVAAPDDAEALFHFGRELLSETDFFLRSPAERANSIDEMRMIINRFQELPRHLLLNAWKGNFPVGEAVIMGGELQRNRYTATVGVGVLQKHTGKKLGRTLMEGLEHFAHHAGIHRLELTVMSHNARALRLYEKMQYRVEGMRREALHVNGSYVDEFSMSKLLGEKP